MIRRVVNQVQKAGAKEIRVVTGFGQELVQRVVEPLGAVCCAQVDQKGTGDAVKSASPETIEGTVLILNGDHPLLVEQDITQIVKAHVNSDNAISVVTSVLKNPRSFGRVIKRQNRIKAIIEAKDASADTLAIKEVNTGIYVMNAEILNKYLPMIQNHNAQSEYYLTDIVASANEQGDTVGAIAMPRYVAFGVNTQAELARATQYVYRRKARELMNAGAMIVDPDHTYVDDDVKVGSATVIYPGAFITGSTRIGDFCVIEPHVYLSNVELGDSVQIKASSHLEGCRVESRAVVGPFARLRPKAHVGESAQVGNFVEMKNASLGKGAKAAHLAYIGDASVGENSNIGCGVIFVNYLADRKKYYSTVGKNAFIGSDVQLIAPVEIGDNTVIGAGSTVTKDVPSGALAVARSKMIIKENYQAKTKEEHFSHRVQSGPSPVEKRESEKSSDGQPEEQS